MNSKEIKIIGLGATVQNVLRAIAKSNLGNAEYTFCSTNVKNLAEEKELPKLQIGMAATGGSGTGGNIELGRLSAIESTNKIAELFDNYFKTAIFITRLGIGSGTGAIPIMVQIAKEKKLFTIVVVYTPFQFERDNQYKVVNETIEALKKQADFVLVIDDIKIQKRYSNLSFKMGFEKEGYAITQLIKILFPTNSLKNNITSLKKRIVKIKQGQSIYFGYGEAQGKFKERQAIHEVLKNALSEREDIYGVRNVFVHIGCDNPEITVDVISKIHEAIFQNAGNEGEITFSIEKSITVDDFLSIVIIAS